MRPLRGILYKLISVVCFILMSALIKATSAHVPAGQAVFFRSFFAIPVILVWLAYMGDLREGLKVKSPLSHFFRGFIGTVSMALGFASLGYLPLPEVTILGYAAPLLTVILAALVLGESVRLFRITTVILGLIGVLIVLAPRLTILSGGGGKTEAIGVALALGAALCAAFAQITVRKMVATEKTAAIVFYFSATSAILGLLTLPFGWVMPNLTEALIGIVTGILGGFGQIFLTSSYREADASLVAPFDYASIIFALGIGWYVFGEMPTLTMLSGAAVVIGSGILIIWREHYLGLERARQRKAMGPATKP